QALGRMVRNGGVDVDGVHVGVRQKLVEVGVARLDTPAMPALVQTFLCSPADGVHLYMGMLLVDGNKLSSKTQAHDGNADLLVTGHEMIPLEATVPAFGYQHPAISSRRALGE